MKPSLRLVPSGDPFDADAEALDRIKQGDLGALGELYDRHAEAVLRFARRSAPREDAEDIMQASFLRVAQVAERFERGRSSGRAFLFGVAANVIRERRRAFARLGRALGRLAGDAPTRSILHPLGERMDVARALERLSDVKRMTFVLVEVEGFLCEEVAAMMNVPVGTVWTRLHHARRELRDWLSKGGGQ